MRTQTRKDRSVTMMNHLCWTIAVALHVIAVASAQTATPCCVQEEVNGLDACTSVEYCNQAEANCIGDCEGIWTIIGGDDSTCLALDEACSPTAPRPRCCEPYDCVNAVNNVGTCGVAMPTEPTTSAPADAPVGSPITTLPPTARATYYFGHSLIYHTFTSYPNKDYLAVPYWLDQLYEAAGNDGWYANGEFQTGSPNYILPPTDSWNFGSEGDALSIWQGNFAATAPLFTSIVYTDLNYAQDRAPTDQYGYDENPNPRTPVDSVVRILDFMDQSGSLDIPFFLYECWNDAGIYMPQFDGSGGSATFPTSAQRDAYFAAADFASQYHQWWEDLFAEVQGRRPDADVRLLPMGPLLVDTLRSPALVSVPFHELFEDNSPHGQPSIYFLAAVIQYVFITNERPPASFSVPTSNGIIVDEIGSNFGEIVDFIYDEVQSITGGGTGPTPTTTSPPSTGGPEPTTTNPTFNPTGGPTMAPITTTTTQSPTTVNLETESPTMNPTDATQEPNSGTPCCIQLEINGPDACTTVPYCNQNESNCLGDCEGTWTVINGSTTASPTFGPTSAPDPIATFPPTSQPTVVAATSLPTSNPTTAPSQDDMATTQPPSSPSIGGEPCCIQPEINGPDACTTVPYCNQNEQQCVGDCEGAWTVVDEGGGGEGGGSSPTSLPTTGPPTDGTTSPPTPINNEGNACCIQIEINGPDACTSVEYCNQNQVHCEGDCDGEWAILGGDDNDGLDEPSATSSPSSNPVADVANETTDSGEAFCCQQTEFAGAGCTTVAFCNESQENCLGDCEGIWMRRPIDSATRQSSTSSKQDSKTNSDETNNENDGSGATQYLWPAAALQFGVLCAGVFVVSGAVL